MFKKNYRVKYLGHKLESYCPDTYRQTDRQADTETHNRPTVLHGRYKVVGTK